jgi:iron complex transport system substrate-binding protein
LALSTPQRVVCLQPSATSTVAALGLLDRVVACTKYCLDLCPEVEGKLIVHDSWTAQAEQIVAAKPDVVLASVPYQQEAISEILKAGVPVLLLAPHTLADIYKDIALIAGVMGVPDRAGPVIAGMQSAIEAVWSKTRDLPRQKVWCEEWGKPLIASQRWVAELVEAAGGEPIGHPGKATNPDFVRHSQPDVLIAAWCGAGDRVPLEKIVRDRQWQSLPAAVHARLYCVNDELLNTPGPALIRGLRAIARALHPELFPAVPGVRQISTHTTAVSPL